MQFVFMGAIGVGGMGQWEVEMRPEGYLEVRVTNLKNNCSLARKTGIEELPKQKEQHEQRHVVEEQLGACVCVSVYLSVYVSVGVWSRTWEN